jgi:Arc/MetJ-type ribon-helix-helix transcriptional regulator
VKIITVHVPEGHVKLLDELVAKKIYPNRSEAIRMAIRDLVLKEA